MDVNNEVLLERAQRRRVIQKVSRKALSLQHVVVISPGLLWEVTIPRPSSRIP